MIGLKEMLTFATKLSVLELESQTIKIDIDDYNKILSTLKKRSEKIKLLLKIKGTVKYVMRIGEQICVFKKIQMENREIFCIDEEIVMYKY